jgi:hypothetical protein
MRRGVLRTTIPVRGCYPRKHAETDISRSRTRYRRAPRLPNIKHPIELISFL